MLEKIYVGLDRVNRSDDMNYDNSLQDEATLQQLHSRLRPQVDKLSRLTGRDDLLHLWGYEA